jgi:dienelactone hydrolase
MPSDSAVETIGWLAAGRGDSGAGREFTVTVAARTVPGILWGGDDPSRRAPLVLVGHGGAGHKADAATTELALALQQRHGFAVAAIDGPVHGARRADPGADANRVKTDFRELWSADPRIDAMVADWQAVISALAALPGIDPERIGWSGVSMGTAYGLPLCAQERRSKVAVLGLWGTAYANNQRVVDDAPRVRCPLLFQQKWNDEIFDRAGQLELFDRLGAANKRLHAYMGGHGGRTAEQFDDVARFLAQHLS